MNNTSRGISLYTLLAAVVVLGILGSVVVTSFTGNKTRGRAANTLMMTFAQAAMRFHQDTGCYPRNVMFLVRFDTAYDTSCDSQVTRSAWHGPYVKKPTSSPYAFGYGTASISPRSVLTLYRGRFEGRDAEFVQMKFLSPGIGQSALNYCDRGEDFCQYLKLTGGLEQLRYPYHLYD